MQTALAAFIKNTPAGAEADAILRSCVHCGFCLASCPTYQLLGDELDSPRGRIYLMKQLLEGDVATASTQLHLDRCLTCRACESACPSGVRYGRLLEIGRAVTEERVPRSLAARGKRFLLRKIVPHAARVRALLGVARLSRPLLPRALRELIPPQGVSPQSTPWPAVRHARRVVLLRGCVQDAVEGGINAAAARVLDRIGISALSAAGCCGALSHHLSAHGETLAQLRRNVDALTPYLDAGAEAIVLTASACSAMVGEYGELLRDDARYAARAARISAVTRDISQLLSAERAALEAALSAAGAGRPGRRVAFHAPCSLQHALKASGIVEPLLREAGFTLTAVGDGQRCCGSAGTYSILQPQLSARLKAAKVAALNADSPQIIASANIGCLLHIRSGTTVPVCHWVELLAASLADG
jgi:glycolate oxidase iron-sulfur subunit